MSQMSFWLVYLVWNLSGSSRTKSPFKREFPAFQTNFPWSWSFCIAIENHSLCRMVSSRTGGDIALLGQIAGSSCLADIILPYTTLHLQSLQPRQKQHTLHKRLLVWVAKDGQNLQTYILYPNMEWLHLYLHHSTSVWHYITTWCLHINVLIYPDRRGWRCAKSLSSLSLSQQIEIYIYKIYINAFRPNKTSRSNVQSFQRLWEAPKYSRHLETTSVARLRKNISSWCSVLVLDEFHACHLKLQEEERKMHFAMVGAIGLFASMPGDVFFFWCALLLYFLRNFDVITSCHTFASAKHGQHFHMAPPLDPPPPSSMRHGFWNLRKNVSTLSSLMLSIGDRSCTVLYHPGIPFSSIKRICWVGDGCGPSSKSPMEYGDITNHYQLTSSKSSSHFFGGGLGTGTMFLYQYWCPYISITPFWKIHHQCARVLARYW